MLHKNLHVEMVNMRATYNNIKIEEKPDSLKNIGEIDSNDVAFIPKSNDGTATSRIIKQLRERIYNVEAEMTSIGSSLHNFLNVVDEDFRTLIENTKKMKVNQDKLHSAVE